MLFTTADCGINCRERSPREDEMVPCPVCDGQVELPDDTVQGELIECPECGSELEVTGVDPYTLDEAPSEQEDWGE
jgi:alpha-aminoadipate carrier protein LysW